MRPVMHVVVLLLALAGSARADGFNLAWQNCYPEGGEVSRSSTCTLNGGQAAKAVASFSISTSWTDFMGIVPRMSVQTETALLPAWWQFFNAGSCRQNAMAANFDFTASPNQFCHDPWAGNGVGGIAAYQLNADGDASKARIVIVGVLAPGFPGEITANQEYYAFAVHISNALTTTCSGCLAPATLVLESIQADHGTPGNVESRMITTPLQNQCITWQHTQNVCATAALPNRSWGQIKTLYR